MALLGYISLILALLAALYSGVAFILGERLKKAWLTRTARSGVWGVAGLVSLAVLVLLLALLGHDFGIKYVAEYSSKETTLAYLISALWAGNAGSILFWGWIVALAGAVVLWRSQKSGREIMPYVQPVILLTEVFFLILLIFTTNPFEKLAEIPADGIGLNPLLENVGMIFHPPLLLAGFALFAVPFALAIAALIKKKLDNDWVVSAKRWALAAWLLLGLGNILGAWWAYAELGWGGYWAWDPVENAGLMPWLMVTAFLHSSMMQRRRGIFKNWSLVLIILAFLLTIFGAFLTRSDILSSVHTFGATAMGPLFLIFLSIILVGSFGLLIWRRKYVKDDEPGDEAIISGDNTFLLNNLLLLGATFAIFIGTMFPFFTQVFSSSRMEVDKAFFNQVNIPIFLAIIMLAGICVFVGWKKPDLHQLGRRLLWPAVAALLLVVILLIVGLRQWYALAGFFILTFVLGTTLEKWWRDVAARHKGKNENYFAACWGIFKANRSRYGGYIIHIAIIIIALGVLGSSVYDVKTESVLKPGESMTIKGYTLTYQGLLPAATETKMMVSANVEVSRGGRVIAELHPQKYLKLNYDQVVTEVAIRSNLAEDLYVILDDWDEAQTAAFTVLVNPLVAWIWVGGYILLLGGLVSFSAPPRKAVTAEG